MYQNKRVCLSLLELVDGFMKYVPLGGKFRKTIVKRSTRQGELTDPKDMVSFGQLLEQRKKIADRFDSDARRFSGAMFKHAPLADLLPEERKTLRFLARYSLRNYASNRLNNTFFPASESVSILPADARKRSQAILKRGIQGSRGVLDAYGDGVFQKADELVKRFGTIEVLDVGAGQGHSLADFRKRYKRKVKTHSISYEDEPTGARFEHVLEAAYLPKVFRNKFHLVISSLSFRYMAMPGHALENCLKALKPGGYAYLRVGYGSEVDRYLPFPHGLASFLHSKLKKRYPRAFVLEVFKACPYTLEKVLSNSNLTMSNIMGAIKQDKKRFEKNKPIESQIGRGSLYDGMGGLANLTRQLELYEEIERLKFLHKVGVIKLTLSEDKQLSIPWTVEFVKVRNPTQQEELVWKNTLENQSSFTLEEMVKGLRNVFYSAPAK